MEMYNADYAVIYERSGDVYDVHLVGADEMSLPSLYESVARFNSNNSAGSRATVVTERLCVKAFEYLKGMQEATTRRMRLLSSNLDKLADSIDTASIVKVVVNEGAK